MKYSEDVKKLAETLKNSGLAASMTDALERAQRMIGKNENPRQAPKEEPMEASQTTLGEPAIDESPQPEEELKKEDVFTEKPAEMASESQNKVDYSKEKKIDLSDIFNVNK